MKIKTINVIVTYEYAQAEIHSYFIADNLPANTVNESVAEAVDKFRTCIEEVIETLSLKRISDMEMAEAMELEFWESGTGIEVEIIRSAE